MQCIILTSFLFCFTTRSCDIVHPEEKEKEKVKKREKDALVACRKLQASVNINFVKKEQVFRIRNFLLEGKWVEGGGGGCGGG